MTKEINQLQRRIMQRIYYAFAKRIVTSTITVQLAIFALALYMFAKLVFVRSVIDNMLSTELGGIPQFILGAFLNGEVLTLISVGVLLFITFSLPLQIRAQFVPRMRTA